MMPRIEVTPAASEERCPWGIALPGSEVHGGKSVVFRARRESGDAGEDR
jgi:hypothetical protein